MIRKEVKVHQALHARPLDQFVRLARSFNSQIQVQHGPKGADGKNVVQLLLLAVPAGGEVTLEVTGADEEAAAAALREQLSMDSGSTTEPEKKRLAPGTGSLEKRLAPGAGSLEKRLAPDHAPDKRMKSDAKQESKPGGSADALEFVLEIAGVPGAPGRGVGRVQWVRRAAPAGTDEAGEATSPEVELQRVQEALRVTVRATRQLAKNDDPFCDIFRAQLALLEDPSLQQELERRVEQGSPAERAAQVYFATLEEQFGAMGSSFFQDRHSDVADVRDRILESLGMARVELSGDGTGEKVVLVVGEATPSRMATLDLQRVAAVISLRGGGTSHAAIVARGRGVPLVFAGADLLEGVEDGQLLGVDGATGLIHNAEHGTWSDQREEHGDHRPAVQKAIMPWTPPGEETVVVYANLGAPGDLAAALEAGCDGCGLLRSELLYQGRAEAPSVEQQVDAYGRVASALAPRPLVVRLFDAGSDKPLAFLPGSSDHEPNPALGLRGLRLLRRHPRVLDDQLEAIARARDETSCDISALVPMVVQPGDVTLVRRAVADRCPVGAMIETPAAAALARAVAAEAAFLSVGTNDLTQYVLAADRQTGGMAGLHPAVLRVMAGVAQSAREAGVPCSVCGELAGDSRTAPLLAGLGLTLSVAPALISPVRHILGGWTREALGQLARQALELDDAQALDDLLRGNEKRT